MDGCEFPHEIHSEQLSYTTTRLWCAEIVDVRCSGVFTR
jgi:hypothetical protein